MASKTKIYIVLEFVTGGELFDKIVRTWLLLHLLMVTYLIYCYKLYTERKEC
jgi:hypothetical protein